MCINLVLSELQDNSSSLVGRKKHHRGNFLLVQRSHFLNFIIFFSIPQAHLYNKILERKQNPKLEIELEDPWGEN